MHSVGHRENQEMPLTGWRGQGVPGDFKILLMSALAEEKFISQMTRCLLGIVQEMSEKVKRPCVELRLKRKQRE
jgi:hypothetical protein